MTLWAVHVQGPDTIVAMPDKETAERRAKEWQEMSDDLIASVDHTIRHLYSPIKCVAIEWPYDADSHAFQVGEHDGNPTDVC